MATTIPSYRATRHPTVTVANGANITPSVDIGAGVLCGIFFPAAMTSATFTVQASPDGVTFYPVYDPSTGSTVSRPVVAGGFVPLDPSTFAGFRYLKINVASNEGALRTLTLSIRSL